MKQQIETMLALQEQMNTKVDPNWQQANNEWYRAIWVECGEMMDHASYKWWKKQEIDVAQVQLEIIDVCHFMLAIALLNKQVYTSSWIQSCLLHPYPTTISLNEAIDSLAFNQLAQRNKRPMFDRLAVIMKHVNMDFNELFKQYCAKNVLNIFRQSNGYKEGTYTKLWYIDHDTIVTQVEDNEALANILQVYDGTEINFMKQVRDDLTKLYANASVPF